MLKTRVLFVVFAAALGLSCGAENRSEPATNAPSAKSSNSVSSDTANAAPKPPKSIDVLKLADKSIADFDAAFGRPEESKAIENNGQYRLYKVNGHTRGLAVRFYGDRAKEFNLILDRPVPTAKDALKLVFGIDVGNAAPVKDAKEPLSESYRGRFGGVSFVKVSAKKQENGNGFIFVLANVAK